MSESERLCAVVQVRSDATSLMIEPDEDGEGVYLFRHTEAREIGDTWHESVAEAFGQAEFEYEIEPESWVRIPVEVGDPIAFSRAQARTTHR